MRHPKVKQLSQDLQEVPAVDQIEGQLLQTAEALAKDDLVGQALNDINWALRQAGESLGTVLSLECHILSGTIKWHMGSAADLTDQS